MEIKGSHYTYTQTDCYCPQCKKEHIKWVESQHAKSEFAWRIKGRLAILCVSCRETLLKKVVS